MLFDNLTAESTLSDFTTTDCLFSSSSVSSFMIQEQTYCPKDSATSVDHSVNLRSVINDFIV
jgi:hypothetical protein